jgi:hypothetical protein
MKKKLVKYLYIILATGTVLASSCSKIKDFGDINTSPNSPATPQTSLLLSNAERYLGRTAATGTTPSIINNYAPRLFVQHISETLYTSESRYATSTYDYSALYNNPLEDLTTIIKLNTDAATKGATYVINGGSNANQIAAARILKAFYFLNITDRWGDIPYSEALQGLTVVTPKFDTQQSIYASLFSELKAAAAQFDNTNSMSGDFLFGGSTAKWKKFAATIRLHMALRLSKVDPNTGKTEFNAALTDGVLASNSDNIIYTFLGESANENNIYNNYEVAKRYDYAISKTMVDQLNSLSDPRLPVYADKTAAGTYVGMPYGLTQSQSSAFLPGTVTSPGNISLIGQKFRLQNSPVAIYTYAMVQFAKAEAYKLGWISGAPDDANAAASYLSGINASMSQQGVTPAASYFTQAAVAYDPANAIKQIITQKWISTYMGYGDESWDDWRRTGFPTLTPAPAALSVDKQIPRRHNYNTNEKDLNGTNYAAVIARQGPDVTSTRVYWDKQ